MQKLIAIPLCLALFNCHAAEYEFHFWPGPKRNDPRIVATEDGPCGEVRVARVESMPKYSKNASLIPERVFELDAQFRIVRAWQIPVNSFPEALEENVLHFSFAGSAYSVTTSGSIAKFRRPLRQKEPTAITCKLPKPFSDSDYAGCWLFEDAKTRRLRVLAFEGLCT